MVPNSFHMSLTTLTSKDDIGLECLARTQSIAFAPAGGQSWLLFGATSSSNRLWGGFLAVQQVLGGLASTVASLVCDCRFFLRQCGDLQLQNIPEETVLCI